MNLFFVHIKSKLIIHWVGLILFKLSNLWSYFASISSTLVWDTCKGEPRRNHCKITAKQSVRKEKGSFNIWIKMSMLSNIVVNLIRVGDKATHYHFKPWRLLTDLVRTSEPIWSYATGTLTTSKGQDTMPKWFASSNIIARKCSPLQTTNSQSKGGR